MLHSALVDKLTSSATTLSQEDELLGSAKHMIWEIEIYCDNEVERHSQPHAFLRAAAHRKWGCSVPAVGKMMWTVKWGGPANPPRKRKEYEN